MSRRPAGAFAVASLTAALMAASPFAWAALQLEVTAAEGKLPAEARTNVLALLSLSRYRNRDDLGEELLQRLQDRASREARTALRPFGFYGATATAWAGPVAGSHGKDWRARVRIIPGPRVLWAQPEITLTGPGVAAGDFVEALSRHGIRAGAPLLHAQYDALKGELERTAATLGYLDARFEVAELQVDPTRLQAQAVLHFHTGARYRFGTTTLPDDAATTGPIDESVLRKFLRWRENSPFDATLLLGTQFALDDSLYFSTVELVPGEPDRQRLTVPVTLQVTAGQRHRLAASVGYATDTQGRASALWEDRRVNRLGHRAGASARWAGTGRALEVHYSLPVGDPALEELRFQVAGEDQSLADVTTGTTRLRGERVRVRGRWQQVWALTAERSTTRTAEAISRDTLVVPSLTLSAAPRGLARSAWSARTATNLATELPLEGLLARVEGSTAALGSRSSFLRLYLRNGGHRAINEQWRWNWRAEAGSSLVRDFEALPASYRFFAGGDRSVRGFALNDLGPRDAAGLRSGARHLLVGSLELERKLPRQLAAAVFVDAGNAFDSPRDGLAVAVGFGIRYRLPVINLGLDLAQAIRAPGGGGLPGPRLHLSLSPAFSR